MTALDLRLTYCFYKFCPVLTTSCILTFATTETICSHIYNTTPIFMRNKKAQQSLTYPRDAV